MELIKFNDFLLEKEITGIVKRKEGLNIPFTELGDWLTTTPNGFRNVAAVVKSFNDYYKVNVSNFTKKEFEALENQNILIKDGKGYKVNLAFFGEDKEDNKKAPTLSDTKVSSLSKGKTKKLKIPQGKSESKYQDFLDTVLMNMLGESQSKLLLTGDPGTGKSRTVENVMSFLRLQVITVEAPHVSEEDIINIPYLVKRGEKEFAENSSFKETSIGFEVVQAESALITRLKSKKKITDNEYDIFLKKNKILQPLYEDYKDTIEEVSNKYGTVLFLDEFYRSSSIRIQNLFRTILNGKLGTTPIPKNVYIIYASNMDNSDGSLDDIPLNHQFDRINFDTPSKEDFLRYMADRFTNIDVNTGEEEKEETIINDDGTEEKTTVENPINEIVYNDFADALSNDDLGGKDRRTGIRVSPRRWEEIIKYISANIPVNNEYEAMQLITFLKDNFKDYRIEEVSGLYNKYLGVLQNIIKESSNIDISKLGPLPASEWRGTLDSQIKTKMKLGGDRKYVPIISGMPGIGKTTIVTDISKRYNLREIIIDASTLNAEDSIGLTTPSGEGKHLTTEFSEPPLYTQIMDRYDPTLQPQDGNKYTHILFIDEISRTSIKVFNSIRSLMLDKKVGELKIPDNIMIIAAMNPKDDGAIDLSDHLVDTVDVIDSEAKFSDVIDYVTGKKQLTTVNDKIGFDLVDISYNILKQCVERFQSSEYENGEDIESENTKKFYWTDGFNVFYISAREMDSILSGCVIDSYNIIKIKKRFDKTKQYNDETIDELVNLMVKTMLNKYKASLSFIIENKADIDSNDFEKVMIGVEDIIGSNSFRIRDGLTTIKSEALQSIKSIVEGANYDIDELLNYDGIVTILEKTIADSDVNTFSQDIAELMDHYVNFSNVTGSIDNIIGLWKLLAMVDWDKFDGEITAQISELFLDRAFNPIINYALDNLGEELAEYGDNENLQKYPGLIDIIIDRKQTNIHNMFVTT